MISSSGLFTRTIFLSILLLLPVLASSQPAPQFSNQAEELFVSGLALYKKGEFESAAAVFGRIARELSRNQRTTAAYVMKAKAEVYGGNTADAEKTLQAFLTSYPTSTYIPDAEFTFGLLYLKKLEYTKAASSLLIALRSSVVSPSGLKEEDIFSLLDETIDRYISLDTLQSLKAQAKNLTEEEYLSIKIGEKQAAAGDYAAAESTLDILTKKFTRPAFAGKISALETQLQKPRPIKLGVLLSLMRKSTGGREKETGASVLEGIEFALEEHLKNSELNISLEIRDTENDLSLTASSAKELAEDPSVIVVLGPAFSDEALAASAVANDREIPMITPTATANGIATWGQFMFQANPDFDTRAKAMAQHAVKNLRLKRIAILSPNQEPNKSSAEVFAKEAKRLGAYIVGTEWYEKGSSDITKQLGVLHKKANVLANQPFIAFNRKITMNEIGKLNRLGVSMKVLDSLMMERSIVNATELLGDNAKSKLQANAIPFTIGDPRLDSLQRIMTAIEGVYCPISSSSEIGVISSQLMYAGFDTKILGSGEWNDLAELNANRRSCSGVQFESDGYIDTRNPLYTDFVGCFFRRHSKMPVKNSVYGYDVANLVLMLITQGATTREQLKDALSNVVSFESLHSKISFSSRRTNSWLNILEYSNKTVRRTGEVKVE